MILSVPQAETNLAEELQNLLDKLPTTHPKRNKIEANLRKILSGATGEKGVAYHLGFWYQKDESVIVANNLRLEFGGRSAQIDHLLAVPAGFLVLESKALPDHVVISEEGEWFKVKVEKSKETKREGIYNPVEQNRRHIAVLEDICRDLNINPLPPFASVVVLTRPEVVIEGYKPNKEYRLIRLDQLNAFVDKCRAAAPKTGIPATDVIHQLLKYHQPITVDVYNRYGIDPTETLPLNERIVFDYDNRVYKCAFCQATMVLQKTKQGLFWGCPNYPRCKNLVTAGIAAQVGAKTAEERESKKGLLSKLLTSRVRPCPNCGTPLVWKKSKKGEYLACPNAHWCKYKH